VTRFCVFLVAAMPAVEEGKPQAAQRLPAERLPPGASRHAPMAGQTGSHSREYLKIPRERRGD